MIGVWVGLCFQRLFCAWQFSYPTIADWNFHLLHVSMTGHTSKHSSFSSFTTRSFTGISIHIVCIFRARPFRPRRALQCALPLKKLLACGQLCVRTCCLHDGPPLVVSLVCPAKPWSAVLPRRQRCFLSLPRTFSRKRRYRRWHELIFKIVHELKACKKRPEFCA